MNLGGYELLVPAGDPDFGAIIARYRQYEEPVRQVLRDHLHSGDVCLDVGANIGVMSFLASSLVGSAGLVFAVEANPDNVQLLYRTIHLTAAANVVGGEESYDQTTDGRDRYLHDACRVADCFLERRDVGRSLRRTPDVLRR